MEGHREQTFFVGGVVDRVSEVNKDFGFPLRMSWGRPAHGRVAPPQQSIRSISRMRDLNRTLKRQRGMRVPIEWKGAWWVRWLR